MARVTKEHEKLYGQATEMLEQLREDALRIGSLLGKSTLRTGFLDADGEEPEGPLREHLRNEARVVEQLEDWAREIERVRDVLIATLTAACKADEQAD